MMLLSVTNVAFGEVNAKDFSAKNSNPVIFPLIRSKKAPPERSLLLLFSL